MGLRAAQSAPSGGPTDPPPHAAQCHPVLLCRIARQTGFLTERMRPFPCEEINFSGGIHALSRRFVTCGRVVVGEEAVRDR